MGIRLRVAQFLSRDDPVLEMIAGTGISLTPGETVAGDAQVTIAATGGVSTVNEVASFTRSGALVVGAGVARFPLPAVGSIVGVIASVGTAPVGAAVIADVKLNGTTIFTTTANRPTIADGAHATTAEPAPDVTTFAAGDYLTMDVAQVGSGTAGSDLTVQVVYTLGAPPVNEIASFVKSGVVAVAAGTGRFPMPGAGTIVSVSMAINTAPTGTTSTPISGTALVCDVNKNGTTIFTTQANRPHIASGGFATTSSPVPDVNTFSSGDYLSVDVDFVGSTVAGSDLSVQIVYRLT